MIVRVWHGWTAPESADRYEALLKSEIFPGILGKNIAGFIDIQLMRRDLTAEVEFMTIMRFDSLHAVKAFIGEDHETAYVPAKARSILARFDLRAQHYEIREMRLAG